MPAATSRCRSTDIAWSYTAGCAASRWMAWSLVRSTDSMIGAVAACYYDMVVVTHGGRRAVLRSCCFNWRVWAGAGIVAVIVLAVAPGAAGAVVPLALGTACPLSMLMMMRGMRPSGTQQSARSTTGTSRARIAALESELARLRAAERPPGDRGHPRAAVPTAQGREATPTA